MDYRIFPPEELIDCSITLPLSKSESNRALIINALTPNSEPLTEVAQCDDTNAMVEALQSTADVINVGAAGTAMRFLTAYFASIPGRKVTLDGSERMRQRPIRELVDALRRLGASIDYIGEAGYPPLRIEGKRLAGGEIDIDPTISSQYLSALLMVGPLMEQPLTLRYDCEPASLPYLLMTIAMMEQCGAQVTRLPGSITVTPGAYRPAPSLSIGRDWSAASYWYAITAIGSAYVALPGLSTESLQGDRMGAEIFAQLGVVTETDCEGVVNISPSPELYGRLSCDMTDTPDIAQTVAVACAAVGIPFTITGLASLRIKETDRIEALARELHKLGVAVETTQSSITWDGARHPVFEMPQIDTYSDHRMAMAFAPVALLVPGIVVRDVDVVAKSYPGFWEDLRSAGFTLVDASLPYDPDASTPDQQ